MGLFHKKARGGAKVSVTHYAPDVTVCAADYFLPVSSQERLTAAEKRMVEFLAATSPDALCGFYFDSFIAQEEKSLLATLCDQVSWHHEAIHSIASKHQAELSRLREAIHYAEDARKQLSEDIRTLQELYDRVNL